MCYIGFYGIASRDRALLTIRTTLNGQANPGQWEFARRDGRFSGFVLYNNLTKGNYQLENRTNQQNFNSNSPIVLTTNSFISGDKNTLPNFLINASACTGIVVYQGSKCFAMHMSPDFDPPTGRIIDFTANLSKIMKASGIVVKEPIVVHLDNRTNMDDKTNYISSLNENFPETRIRVLPDFPNLAIWNVKDQMMKQEEADYLPQEANGDPRDDFDHRDEDAIRDREDIIQEEREHPHNDPKRGDHRI